MDIRVLRYFLMVAREENITKASSLLHITQPTLSRQLMQLEDELGVKLFTRKNHSIVLTDDGMLFRRRAQEIVDLAEKTKLELDKNEKELSGEISIGAGELLSVNILSKIMADFKAENPKIKFKMFSGNADVIKERMSTGLIDIGLLLQPVDVSRYDFINLNIDEEWGVLANENSPLTKKDFVTPDDLKNQKLLLSERELVKSKIATWLGDDFKNYDITANYNLIYNAAVMVRNNMGVAICLKLDCKYEKTKFLPCQPSLLSNSVIAWNKNKMQSREISAFIEFAKKYIK